MGKGGGGFQDFPEGGAPTHYLANWQKMHPGERNWTERGTRVPGASLGSANAGVGGGDGEGGHTWILDKWVTGLMGLTLKIRVLKLNQNNWPITHFSTKVNCGVTPSYVKHHVLNVSVLINIIRQKWKWSLLNFLPNWLRLQPQSD